MAFSLFEIFYKASTFLSSRRLIWRGRLWWGCILREAGNPTTTGLSGQRLPEDGRAFLSLYWRRSKQKTISCSDRSGSGVQQPAGWWTQWGDCYRLTSDGSAVVFSHCTVKSVFVSVSILSCPVFKPLPKNYTEFTLQLSPTTLLLLALLDVDLDLCSSY